MRNNYHLQERHLLECVRRNVISNDQMESILAVARTMQQAEGGVSPDFGWVTAVQAVAAGGMVLIPAIYLLAKLDRLDSLEFGLLAALGAAASLGFGWLLRRRGVGRVPASIFFGGAPIFFGGVGLALYAAIRHVSFGYHSWDYSGTAYQSIRAGRLEAFIVGLLVVVATSALIARKAKVATAIGTLSGAVCFLALSLGERLALTSSDGYFNDRQAVPWLVGAAAVVFGGAFAWDKLSKNRLDGAFWAYLIGFIPLGFAGLIRIDRVGEEGALWLALALVFGFLGLKFDRKILLAGSALGVLVFPAFALSELRIGEEGVVASLIVSAIGIAFGATSIRRHLAKKWAENPTAAVIERTVWE